MKQRLGILIAVCAAAGCSRQPDLMPMRVGRSTTYEVSYGLEKHVEPVEVTRTVPVEGVTGFELSGAMGVSRLAWKGGVLLASQTATAFFDPPLPILAADSKPRQWSGTIQASGGSNQATASLTQKQDKLDVGPRTLAVTLATVTIQLPKGVIQLDSWFQPGVGLVRQEQRTNDQLVVRMEMLGSPKD